MTSHTYTDLVDMRHFAKEIGGLHFSVDKDKVALRLRQIADMLESGEIYMREVRCEQVAGGEEWTEARLSFAIHPRPQAAPTEEPAGV